MKKTKNVLVFLLCTLMTTAFCSVPLSASAEDNILIDSKAVISEMPTESKTVNILESESIELCDTMNEDTNSSEMTCETASTTAVNTGSYSRSKKAIQNESSAKNTSVTSSANVTSIKLEETSLTLGVGETYTLSKSITPSNATTTFQ